MENESIMARKKDAQAVPVAKTSATLNLILWVLIILVSVNTYLLLVLVFG